MAKDAYSYNGWTKSSPTQTISSFNKSDQVDKLRKDIESLKHNLPFEYFPKSNDDTIYKKDRILQKLREDVNNLLARYDVEDIILILKEFCENLQKTDEYDYLMELEKRRLKKIEEDKEKEELRKNDFIL